jgi:hypothetical protein
MQQHPFGVRVLYGMLSESLAAWQQCFVGCAPQRTAERSAGYAGKSGDFAMTIDQMFFPKKGLNQT